MTRKEFVRDVSKEYSRVTGALLEDSERIVTSVLCSYARELKREIKAKKAKTE